MTFVCNALAKMQSYEVLKRFFYFYSLTFTTKATICKQLFPLPMRIILLGKTALKLR